MANFRLRRSYVLAYMVIFSVVILFALSQMYDDFNRNPSIDETNKALIERYLSEQDRRMLIDENIPTQRFIRFIQAPGFTLANYEYYEVVDQNTDLDTNEVVDYTNQLVHYEFTLSGLRNILENKEFSVNQLISLAQFSESNPNISVDFFPNDLLALANQTHYIGNFSPNNLVEINKAFTNNKTKKITGEANDALNRLCDAMALLNSQPCGGLSIDYAYISYKSLTNNPDNYPHFLVPGKSDLQLGRSIILHDDQTKANPMYLWLLENAHNFGFTLRFPDHKEEVTGIKDQPFVFRYVGTENATYMYEHDLALEEMS